MFSKVVRIGTAKTHAGRAYSIFCKISYRDGKLSITGVEGPLHSGNAIGACGQIEMHLRPSLDTITPALGWDAAMLAKFFDIWHKWHLNDMQAGSPAQAAELARHEFPGYPVSHYDWAKEILRVAGLQPDASYLHEGKPYSYGSAWLRTDVPVDVLEWLEALPLTDKAPAWV